MNKKIKGLEKIARIKGVREFLLVDANRVVKAHGAKDPEKKAESIINCSQKAGSISRSGYQYLLFSRKNQNHLLVFPVGSFALGIVQEKGVNSLMLANQVKKALKDIDFIQTAMS
ncbi:hypothetical protein [Desulfobacter sp.]